MNHTVIIGAYRCGTSFMIELLTCLGMDTGFSMEEVEHVASLPGGGFEWLIRGKRAKPPFPYVIKNPKLGTDLADRIERWDWEIDHAYIMIRDAEKATKSWYSSGNRSKRHWTNYSEEILTAYHDSVWRDIGAALVNTEVLNIPYTVIQFPRYVQDVDYAYEKLHFLLHKYSIDYDQFKSVWTARVNKEKIRFK
jgi:hypothetical protein